MTLVTTLNSYRISDIEFYMQQEIYTFNLLDSSTHFLSVGCSSVGLFFVYLNDLIPFVLSR
ncbi:hypothetical protein ISS22_00175 [candidate division KSB1 bacterium]|nr:hypothetical protein [candidate division KSB1 bacterium]